VQLVGKLAREQVIDRYARAAVYVQPSRIAADGDRDGIPNVLLEAMAMGLPVVATRVSGIPELVQHGHNGLLVEPDDANALADAIAACSISPCCRRELGRRPRHGVTTNFDNDHNLRLLLRLLEPGPHVHAPNPASACRRHACGPAPSQTVAYVMNGFPRLSETFIAHEIHQLERTGPGLRLFVRQARGRADGAPGGGHDPRAADLPAQGQLAVGHSLPAWLRDNLPTFASAHLAWPGATRCAGPARWAARWPGLATAPTWRQTRLRKVFVKEFLQAGEIAAGAAGRRRRGPPARPLLPRRGHHHLVRQPPVGRAVQLHRARQGHLPGRAQPRPAARAQARRGALRGHLHLCQRRRAEGAPCAARRGAHHLPRAGHRLLLAAARPADGAPPLILAVGRFGREEGLRPPGRGLRACCATAGRALSLRHRRRARQRLRPQLRAQIDALGLAGVVELRGPMTQDALREVYRGAHVFALPCQVMEDGDRDGFPNVLAEAMAMGVPVVRRRISGIPEMIDDGVHGLLVPTRATRRRWPRRCSAC
jgi:hypothetical protein